MGELSPAEHETIERAASEPMLDQVQAWAAVNSGSRNLPGLEQVARLIAEAFSTLPGEINLEKPAPVERHTSQRARLLS